MTITLRQLTDPQATTKGTALSFSEMDNNFIHVLNNGIIVVGDDSTGTEFTLGNTLKITGSGGSTVAVSGDTVTVNAISQLEDDPSPSLGAQLDLDQFSIINSGGAGNIELITTSSGFVRIGDGGALGFARLTTSGLNHLILQTGNDATAVPKIEIEDNNNINIVPYDTQGQTIFGDGVNTAILSTDTSSSNLRLKTNKLVTSSEIVLETNDILLKPTTSSRVVVGNGSAAGIITSSGAHSLILSTQENDVDSAFIELEDSNTGSIILQPGTTEDSAGGNRLRITMEGGDNGQFVVDSGGTGGMVFANNEAEDAYPTGALVLRNKQNNAEINFGQYHIGSDILFYSVYFDPNANKFIPRSGAFPGDQNVNFGFDYQNNHAIVQGNGGDKFQIDCFNDFSQGYGNKGPIELLGGYVSIGSQLPYLNIQAITDSTQPPRPESSANLFAADDGGTVEMYVQDEASNITKISPHNDQGEWEYYSRNSLTGKTVRVNMEKMIKRLEQITGESFFEEYTPGN